MRVSKPIRLCEKRLRAAAVVLAVLLAAFASAQTAPFLAGWNHPWVAYGHDFGGNAWGHDGIITSGWSYQTYAGSAGFTDAKRIERSDCLGGVPALRIAVNLQGGSVSPNANGEVELTISNHPPRLSRPVPGDPTRTVTLPDTSVQSVNLDGKTAAIRLCLVLPPGSAGSANAPNGIQLFFKTRLSPSDFPSLYCPSPWQNLDPSWIGRPITFSVTVSNTTCARYGLADATKVAIIGFKMGMNQNSTNAVGGYIDIESFELATSPSIRYDFTKLELEKDFEAAQALSGNRLSVSRMFLFTDGRAGIDFAADGSVIGLNRFFSDDFDEALRIAERTRIKIMPALLDFCWFSQARWVSGVQLGGRGPIVTDPLLRQQFLERVMVPLLQRYANNPWIYAWDILNEPEWAMQGVPDSIPACEGAAIVPISSTDMQGFSELVARTITSFNPDQRVTVGSARRMWLQYWSGTAASNPNRFVYQFHWYDKFEATEPFPSLSATQLAVTGCGAQTSAWCPVLVGEVPTERTKTAYTACQYLTAAQSASYLGPLIWSFRAGDEFSNFESAATNLTTCTYLVGDVYPVPSSNGDLNGDGTYNDAGEFGDNKLNILDLIIALRAVTGVSDLTACTERFDAADTYPPDTDTTRGGDGRLNILDLIITLRRVTGLDTYRPARVHGRCIQPSLLPGQPRRGGTSPAAAARPQVTARNGAVRLELGEAVAAGADRYRVPLYANADVALAGLALSVRSNSEAALTFVADANVGNPSLVDDSIADALSIAWLDKLNVNPGGRALLGYVQVRTSAGRAIPTLTIGAGSAVDTGGNEITLGAGAAAPTR